MWAERRYNWIGMCWGVRCVLFMWVKNICHIRSTYVAAKTIFMTVELTCGGTSSENATYIINTSPTESCSYTICPCSDAICRIRFDFETLTLADPFVGTAADTVTANIGSQIGDCKTDQFSISGERGGSPVICGENSGQHSKLTFIAGILNWQSFRIGIV